VAIDVITGLTLPISVISRSSSCISSDDAEHADADGLSLAIGLLIDDAIVVGRTSYAPGAREDHFEAAARAPTRSGSRPLHVDVDHRVFVPVAFMKGIIGRFFFQFGLTVAFAVLVSLFVSFTLDPMLSSRWHDPDILRAGKRSWWHRPLDWFNERFERMAEGYKRLIGWSSTTARPSSPSPSRRSSAPRRVRSLEAEFMTPWTRASS